MNLIASIKRYPRWNKPQDFLWAEAFALCGGMESGAAPQRRIEDIQEELVAAREADPTTRPHIDMIRSISYGDPSLECFVGWDESLYDLFEECYGA